MRRVALLQKQLLPVTTPSFSRRLSRILVPTDPEQPLPETPQKDHLLISWPVRVVCLVSLNKETSTGEDVTFLSTVNFMNQNEALFLLLRLHLYLDAFHPNIVRE